MNPIKITLFLASLTGVILQAQPASADCSWTVQGKLTADHMLDTLSNKLGPGAALKDVEVEVSGKTSGWFNSWGTVRTNDSGVFSITRTKSCADRTFRVKVKFQNAALEVRHENSTSSTTKVKWYTIIDQSGSHTSGTVNLGERTFRAGGNHDLGDYEARSHADIWQMYQLALNHLSGLGFPITGQVAVKYPHDGVTGDSVEASYVNPTTKIIYIVKNSQKDHLSKSTLLHELGHRWAYDHVSGEICLTESLLLDGSTHGLVSDPCVAFHEGFAEFFKNKMGSGIFGDAPHLPYNRAVLKNMYAPPFDLFIDNIAEMQRFDEGMTSVFHILTTHDLASYDFLDANTAMNTVQDEFVEYKGPTPLCTDISLSFADVLAVVDGMTRSEMTIGTLLDRVEAFFPTINTVYRGLLQNLADPASTAQPTLLLCS